MRAMIFEFVLPTFDPPPSVAGRIWSAQQGAIRVLRTIR